MLSCFIHKFFRLIIDTSLDGSSLSLSFRGWSNVFMEAQDLIKKTVGDTLQHVGATVLLSLQISLLTNIYKWSHEHIFFDFSVICYRYILVVIMKKLLVALAFCFFLVFVSVLCMTYHHDLKSTPLESPPHHVIRQYFKIQQVGRFFQFYLALWTCILEVPFGEKRTYRYLCKAWTIIVFHLS